jgi:hypothetical protein
MAQVDTNIAMGFRPIQIESPVNQMAAISQLQNLQQQQQMNALKMQEYQQQVQDRNELARIMGDSNLEYGSENFMRQVLARAPSQYETIATRVAQREDLKERTAKREYESQKLKAEVKQRQLEEFRTAQKDIAAFDSIEAVKADIDRKVGSGLLPEDMAANILAGLPQDNVGFPEWKKRTLTSLLTAEKQLERIAPAPAPITESPIARLERERAELASKNPNDPRLKTYDIAIAKETGGTSPEIVREYEYARDPARGKDRFTGSLLEFKEVFARAGRPVSTTQAAPTITMVLDPNDNTRLLSVNAREYKGGSLGSAGVIGIAGKEPTVGKKQEAKEAAQSNAESTIAQLRQSYDQLDKLGGITSTRNRVGTNIAAGLSSSAAGQFTGRLLGTEAQSERNKIAQTRPLLMTTIMQAMGLSAKQLDSNAELKLWLSAATDPTLDLEANRDALNNLERMLTGKGKGAGAGATPPAAPKPKSDVRSRADAILGQ